MVHAAPIVPAPDGSASSDIELDRPVDQVVADLALAFALDIDLARTEETKWPMGQTLAFAILTSATLWALIAGLVYII